MLTLTYYLVARSIMPASFLEILSTAILSTAILSTAILSTRSSQRDPLKLDPLEQILSKRAPDG